jgi:hypothetical protein
VSENISTISIFTKITDVSKFRNLFLAVSVFQKMKHTTSLFPYSK